MLHDAFAVRGPRIDAEGEVSSHRAHVSGSESADASSLASFKTASRTRQLTAATSASWSISSRICCQCGRSSRSLPIAAIYSHASRIVRSVPPSFVGMGGVSFFESRTQHGLKDRAAGRLLSAKRLRLSINEIWTLEEGALQHTVG